MGDRPVKVTAELFKGREIVDKDGNVIQENQPQVVKQVFSKTTSETVLDMMESVVAEGTGKNGKVDGYYIAGKTSTAEQGRGSSAGTNATNAAVSVYVPRLQSGVDDADGQPNEMEVPHTRLSSWSLAQFDGENH